jgi:hypothetical protein
VVDSVEEFLQIQVHGEPIALADSPLYLPDCSMGGASRSEAEARLGELRIEYRREDLPDGLLYHPVHNTRDTQPPLPPLGFGILTRRTGWG